MTALLPARRRRVKRESLTTMLVQDLRSMITSRALKPGDRLPTEQEVANAFGVSRTVVREAVARLKAEGLVETRQGVGAFVSDGMTARSEEHTSELKSLMRSSYAVFCLHKTRNYTTHSQT